MDVATHAVIVASEDNAVGAFVPPSLTEDKDAYVGASVVLEGACVGAFADGAGKSAAGKGGGGGSLAP